MKRKIRNIIIDKLRLSGLWLKSNTVVISIFIVAFIVRLYHVTYPIYDYMCFRQTQTASTIMNYYRNGIDVMLPTVNSIGSPGVLVLEFPLFQAIGAVIYSLISPDIIYIRLLSILCSLIASLYLYKLVVYFFNKTTAIFSLIFFLFAPLNIFFSRTPMIESMAAMLSIMFLYYYIMWIEKPKIYVLILGIILASLAFVVKPPYSLIIFPVIAYYAFYKNGIRTLKDYKLIISLIIPMIILLLWQTHANDANNYYNSITDYPYNILHNSFQVKLNQENIWYFGTLSQRLDPSTYTVVGKRIIWEVLTIIGTLLAFISIPIKNNRHGLLFEVWLATTFLSFVVLLNLNYVHNYYQLPCVSILSIYCGRGLYLIWEKLKQINFLKDHRYKILVLILILYLTNVYYVIDGKKYFENENPLYYTWGQQIHQYIPENDRMVLISTVTNDKWDPSILYYADKKGYMLPHSMLNEEMTQYFIRKGVTWLVVTNQDQFINNYDAEFLDIYPILMTSSQTIVIYRIDGKPIKDSINSGT
jgi:hypothetical protein